MRIEPTSDQNVSQQPSVDPTKTREVKVLRDERPLLGVVLTPPDVSFLQAVKQIGATAGNCLETFHANCRPMIAGFELSHSIHQKTVFLQVGMMVGYFVGHAIQIVRNRVGIF